MKKLIYILLVCALFSFAIVGAKKDRDCDWKYQCEWKHEHKYCEWIKECNDDHDDHNPPPSNQTNETIPPIENQTEPLVSLAFITPIRKHKNFIFTLTPKMITTQNKEVYYFYVDNAVSFSFECSDKNSLSYVDNKQYETMICPSYWEVTSISATFNGKVRQGWITIKNKSGDWSYETSSYASGYIPEGIVNYGHI